MKIILKGLLFTSLCVLSGVNTIHGVLGFLFFIGADGLVNYAWEEK